MVNEDLFQRQKKILVPFLDRAQEIEAIAPKVAYYCRLFALEEAVKLGESNLDPRVKGVIEAVADKLAASAPSLDLDRQRDASECDKFAKMVFARADKMERVEQNEKSLLLAAQTFKYAEQYFRMTMQFGSLSEESERLRKYALWRSLELLKAHKEMRPPVPPPEISADAAAVAELEALIGGAIDHDGIPDAPTSLPGTSPLPTVPSREDELPSVPVEEMDEYEPQSEVKIPSARHFVVGQEVQYCPDGTANGRMLRATIAKAQEVPHSHTSSSTYEIILHDDTHARLVVSSELLAPYIDAGTSMLLFDSGKPEPEVVNIEEVYASRWPPKYLVKRPGRGLVEVEDYELAPIDASKTQMLPPTVWVKDQETQDAPPKGVVWSLVNYDNGEEGCEAEEEEEEEEVARIDDASEAQRSGTLPVQDVVPPAQAAQPAQPAQPVQPAFSNLAERNYAGSYGDEAPLAFATAPPEPVALKANRSSQPIHQTTTTTTQRQTSYSAPLNVVVEAQKATKSAGSALSFDDVDTAVKYLRRALQLLTSSPPPDT